MIPQNKIGELILLGNHLLFTTDDVKVTNKKGKKPNIFARVPKEYNELLDPNDGLRWVFDFFYCQEAVVPHTDYDGKNPKALILPLEWSEKDEPKTIFYKQYLEEKTILDWQYNCGEVDFIEYWQVGKPIWFDTKQVHHGGEVAEWKLAIVGHGHDD